MKSEPRGKSTAREFAYRNYVNGKIDLEIRMNYLIEFSWEIVDEDYYVRATGDNFPISMIKDIVGLQAKMDITGKLNEPTSSIPKAEIPPKELLPGIIEEVNAELIKRCGVEITDARFAEFNVSEADKMKINRLERDMEKIMFYSALAKGTKTAAAASTIQSENPAANHQEKVSWICKCGNVNKTSFCPECGAPRNFKNWVCSCGTKNSGKFCTECGKELAKELLKKT